MSNDSTTPSAAPLPIRTAHDGLALPAMGFGTYQVRGFAGAQAIASALENGYRLLDTAVNYENEGTVGKAIRMASVPRNDIIVTSKLPGRFHQYDKARICIEESLCRLGLDYLDLYLIHWPNPSQGLYVEAWQALVDAQRDGLIRHIGVSNFLPGHIDMLIRATAVTPQRQPDRAAPLLPADRTAPIQRRTWHHLPGLEPAGPCQSDAAGRDDPAHSAQAWRDRSADRAPLASADRRRIDPEIAARATSTREPEHHRIRTGQTGHARHRADGQSRRPVQSAGPALARGNVGPSQYPLRPVPQP